MKKILMAIMTAASVMLFSGCGRSNEQIEKDVKPVVEELVGKIVGQLGMGINANCTQVKDIQKDKRTHYTATAEVKYKNALGQETTEQLDISIAYDKDKVFVKINGEKK